MSIVEPEASVAEPEPATPPATTMPPPLSDTDGATTLPPAATVRPKPPVSNATETPSVTAPVTLSAWPSFRVKPVAVANDPRSAMWLPPVNDAVPPLPLSSVAVKLPVSLIAPPAVRSTVPPLRLPGMSIVEPEASVAEPEPATPPATTMPPPLSDTDGATTLPPAATVRPKPPVSNATEAPSVTAPVTLSAWPSFRVKPVAVANDPRSAMWLPPVNDAVPPLPLSVVALRLPVS